MSETKSEAREFWITGLNDYDKIIFDQDDIKTFKSDFNADGRYIHVVEYSAYEVLKMKHERVLQMLEIAETALEVYAMTNKTFPDYGAVARNALAQIQGMKK